MIVSAIIALGLALGKIRIMGISLGVAFVFFVGILAGNFGFGPVCILFRAARWA